MNYYDVFGVPPSASIEDISAAHKALAKKYHPDINSSRDAHEKMIKLNEANEVLSDSIKRKEYDKEHNLNQPAPKKPDITSPRSPAASSQAAKVNMAYGVRFTDERTEKAELLRKKAEERMRTEDAARRQRTEHEKSRAKASSQNSKQMRFDADKQQVLKVLSDLVIDGTSKQRNNMEIDEDRHYATKVLLSMVRNDNEHLRRRAEEAERKKRIDEILSLVKEYNAEKE